MGGDGSAEDWAAILNAAAAVRATARAYLEGPGRHDLDRTIPYPGQIRALQGRKVSLRYTLFRVVGHTYFHVGPMASDLVTAGLSVGDYPGMMLEALDQEGLDTEPAGEPARHDCFLVQACSPGGPFTNWTPEMDSGNAGWIVGSTAGLHRDYDDDCQRPGLHPEQPGAPLSAHGPHLALPGSSG